MSKNTSAKSVKIRIALVAAAAAGFFGFTLAHTSASTEAGGVVIPAPTATAPVHTDGEFPWGP
jgi:hypothetical protein